MACADVQAAVRWQEIPCEAPEEKQANKRRTADIRAIIHC
jgi:hypothetical protein